jgi:hypothetical protein
VVRVELVFLAKLLASAALTTLTVLGLNRLSWLRRHLAGREPAALALTFALTRLLPFVLIYVLLHELPRGDVPFFYDKAAKALRGGLVYVDFWSYHAPLFAYILAGPLLLWHDPRAVVLLMVLVEGLTVWLTWRHYQPTHGPDALLSAMLYLLLPAPLIMCVFGGQEDVWLWLLGLLAVRLYARKPTPPTARRANGSAGKTAPDSGSAVGLGLGLAAGLLLLKVTFGLIIVPLIWLVRQRWRLLAVLLAVGVPTLAGLYILTGWRFLMPVQHSDLPFSPNLPSVLRPWLFGALNAVPLKTLNATGMLVTVLSVTAAGFRYRRLTLAQTFPALWVVTFGVFQLVQASAMAYYVFVYMLPFVFELVPLTRRGRLAGLLILNWLVVVQPYLTIVHGQPLFTHPTVIAQGINGLVYGLDVATVVGLGWMVWTAVRRLDRVLLIATDRRLL